MFVMLPIVGCGAADGVEGESENVSSTDESITRGTLVSGTDKAVVKLSFPTLGCSGTKIGTNRFLTAAHCVWTLTAGQQVTITNSDSGSGGSTFTVTAVHRYPTQPANLSTGHSTDIGMFDVQQSSATIPTFSAVRGPYIDTGVVGREVAFGCDLANPSHDWKKQTANYTTEFFGDPPSYAGYLFASGDPKPAVCSGDSGGPIFFQRNGVWELGAVVAAGDNNTVSWFTRLGRLKNWIANPTINNFVNGAKGSLLNRLGNNCPGAVVGVDFSWLNYCDLRSIPTDPQYWTLVSTGAGTFNIKNTTTGQCLYRRTTGSPTSVGHAACTASTSMRWRFTSPVSVDGFNYYHIQSVSDSSQCIGTFDGSVDTGRELNTKACSSGVQDEQIWAFVP
jgi:trypsin/ricin-type beta-trefoil lectin protein